MPGKGHLARLHRKAGGAEHGSNGRVDCDDVGGAASGTLEGGEEERAVDADGPAERAAELALPERRLRDVDGPPPVCPFESPGVERPVPVEETRRRGAYWAPDGRR